MPLTDVQIRNAKAKPKAYKISDSNGLFLQVSVSGAKLWRMKFRHGGKEGLLSFGPYPLISLSFAALAGDSRLRDGPGLKWRIAISRAVGVRLARSLALRSLESVRGERPKSRARSCQSAIRPRAATMIWS
jgi:hypothetical protein